MVEKNKDVAIGSPAFKLIIRSGKENLDVAEKTSYMKSLFSSNSHKFVTYFLDQKLNFYR